MHGQQNVKKKLYTSLVNLDAAPTGKTSFSNNLHLVFRETDMLITVSKLPQSTLRF